MATPSHPAPHGAPSRTSCSSGLFYPYLTPHGPLTIRTDGTAITDVVLGDIPLDGRRKPSEAASCAATQIQEYLVGKRREFDLELAPRGSAFQRKVWSAITRIPYGQTRTCAQIAAQIESTGSFRAVGAAVRKNPLTILIPAHRVVDAAGGPLGSGRSAELKGALLRMEREALANSREAPYEGQMP